MELRSLAKYSRLMAGICLLRSFRREHSCADAEIETHAPRLKHHICRIECYKRCRPAHPETLINKPSVFVLQCEICAHSSLAILLPLLVQWLRYKMDLTGIVVLIAASCAKFALRIAVFGFVTAGHEVLHWHRQCPRAEFLQLMDREADV